MTQSLLILCSIELDHNQYFLQLRHDSGYYLSLQPSRSNLEPIRQRSQVYQFRGGIHGHCGFRHRFRSNDPTTTDSKRLGSTHTDSEED